MVKQYNLFLLRKQDSGQKTIFLFRFKKMIWESNQQFLESTKNPRITVRKEQKGKEKKEKKRLNIIFFSYHDFAQAMPRVVFHEGADKGRYAPTNYYSNGPTPK